jgi:tRNA acetyltransferase TAN1
MIRDFNLLATTSRGNERDIVDELSYLFGEIGDSTSTVSKTGIAGLVAAKTSINGLDVVVKFREILRERPYELRYTLRVIPIERVVRTNLGEIEQTAMELGLKIGENESFRVTVEKRFTSIHTQDIIKAAAANVKRKVELDKPDWTLLVEVVGGLTGMSVLRPDDILSVMKEKIL